MTLDISEKSLSLQCVGMLIWISIHIIILRSPIFQRLWSKFSFPISSNKICCLETVLRNLDEYPVVKYCHISLHGMQMSSVFFSRSWSFSLQWSEQTAAWVFIDKIGQNWLQFSCLTTLSNERFTKWENNPVNQEINRI